jgi:outer membrane lipoprotein-sorting protein
MKQLTQALTLFFCMTTGLFHAQTSFADTIPVPNTEYSALKQVVTAQGSFVQTVHHSHGKERSEMEMQGMSMALIYRPDKKLAWQLMPMQKMYMEMDLSSANQMTGNAPDDVTIEKVGNEMLDGINTTKYKLVLKDKSAGGFVWLSPENIALKMDFISKEGKDKNRITMTMKNLKIEPQDSALFELPEGYQPMPSMGDMMKSFKPQ